jgi:hypothetical protein
MSWGYKTVVESYPRSYTSPKTVSQGHHQHRLAARFAYDEAYAARSPELVAPPAAAAWLSPSTGRTAPPSRKPLGLRQALPTGKLTRGARTDHGCDWLVGVPLFFTRAACYTPWPRDGDTILPRVTGLRSAPGVPLVGPREWRQTPGVCGRRFRSRAYERRDPREAPEGQQQGKGHPSVVAARAPSPTLRVVCRPCTRRRRHGDFPGQGAGHLPCRVSRPVSRRPVATGGAVGTAVAWPQPCAGSAPGPHPFCRSRGVIRGSRARRPAIGKKVHGRLASLLSQQQRLT